MSSRKCRAYLIIGSKGRNRQGCFIVCFTIFIAFMFFIVKIINIAKIVKVIKTTSWITVF